MGRNQGGEDVTVFEILALGGRILLGEEENGWIYSWNGSSEFTCWLHAGNGKFYTIDFWTTDVVPKTLEQAMERCRERLSAALADEGMNEFHDMQVDKLLARRKQEAALRQ